MEISQNVYVAVGAAGAATATVLTVAGLLLTLLRHSRASQWLVRLVGEPDPDRTVTAGLHAPPEKRSRVFLTVTDQIPPTETVSIASSQWWERVGGDIGRLVSFVDTQHNYSPRVEQVWRSAQSSPTRSFAWCLVLPRLLKERLIRQLKLIAEDEPSLEITCWETDPRRTLLLHSPSPMGPADPAPPRPH